MVFSHDKITHKNRQQRDTIVKAFYSFSVQQIKIKGQFMLYMWICGINFFQTKKIESKRPKKYVFKNVYLDNSYHFAFLNHFVSSLLGFKNLNYSLGFFALRFLLISRRNIIFMDKNFTE
jgi:hypothetical protein